MSCNDQPGLPSLKPSLSLRSNFISRLSPDKRSLLLTRLSHLAASWGGKDNGFGLSDCCQDKPILQFPQSATTLHFEFYAEVEKSEDDKGKKVLSTNVTVIHVEGLDKMDKTPARIMEELLGQFDVPEEKQVRNGLPCNSKVTKTDFV